MPFHLTPQQRFRLRRLLRTTADLGAYRRTLALLQLDRGDTVTDVAAMLDVSRRTVHRWVGLYWDRPVPRSLITHHSTGRPSEWDEDARAIASAAPCTNRRITSAIRPRDGPYRCFKPTWPTGD